MVGCLPTSQCHHYTIAPVSGPAPAPSVAPTRAPVVVPKCDDGEMNGEAVYCGGSCASRWGLGEGCRVDDDCSWCVRVVSDNYYYYY
jgi:hypothetical protein